MRRARMVRLAVSAALLAAVATGGPTAPGGANAWAAKRRAKGNLMDEGRRRARAGAALSARGHCEGAIREFDAAFAALHDPVILFNRAECKRKIGDDAGAISDYEGYLAGLPKAPNREQVEARIAELRGAADASPADAPAAPIAAPSLPAPAPSLPEAPQPAPAPPRAAEAPIVVASETRAVPSARASETSASAGSGSAAWIVALGVVVLAAAGATGWWLVRRDPTDVPPSTLGGYRF